MLNAFNFEILFFLFFATFISYNFQRIIFHNRSNKSPLISCYNSNKKLIYFFLGFSLLIFLYLFFNLNVSTKIAVILLSLISILYPFGLRNIPYLKIFLIAASWSISTVLLTYFENNLFIDQRFYLEIFARFFFILGITIPFDVRDLKFDNRKLKTIPIVFGFTDSKKIALFFLFIYILISSYVYLFNNFNLSYLLATFFCFLYSAYLVNNLKANSSNFYYSFWLESCSISLLVFLIITSIFL